MINLPKFTFVLGGAASGKSTYAEGLCFESGLDRIYLATAQVYDTEMRAKVDAHRAQRGPDWHTIEEPVEVTPHLEDLNTESVVLIDCATLWLTNLILGNLDVAHHSAALRTAIAQTQARIVIVSNETGYGIVPENALSRKFRSAQGVLNQQLAADADVAIAVMAGLPIALKGQLP